MLMQWSSGLPPAGLVVVDDGPGPGRTVMCRSTQRRARRCRPMVRTVSPPASPSSRTSPDSAGHAQGVESEVSPTVRGWAVVLLLGWLVGWLDAVTLAVVVVPLPSPLVTLAVEVVGSVLVVSVPVTSWPGPPAARR